MNLLLEETRLCRAVIDARSSYQAQNDAGLESALTRIAGSVDALDETAASLRLLLDRRTRRDLVSAIDRLVAACLVLGRSTRFDEAALTIARTELDDAELHFLDVLRRDVPPAVGGRRLR